MGDLTKLPAAPIPTRIRYSVLGFICALSLITYLDRVCIARAAADIERDLLMDDRQMGLIFSAFLLGYTLFEVPGGWMGDRWGSRRVLTGIVLCWSLFTALSGCVWAFSLPIGWSIHWRGGAVPLVLNAFVLLLVIRFCFGLGEAGAYPNITRVVGDWFPTRERAFAQGNIWMAARFGGAVAPVVFGRLTAAIGWRQAFYVLGLLGVGWVVFFARWFRSHPDQHPDVNSAELHLIRDGIPLTPHLPGHAWPGLRVVASSLSLWAMCVAAFWVNFGWYFYPTWQPKYLEDVHHFSPHGWRLEVLSGLPFFCGALGCLAGGGVSDRLVQRLGLRWGRSLIGLGGFTLAGACVLLTGFTSSPGQAVTLLCLAFLVNDLAIPVLWACAADVGGRFAGTVAGLVNMVGGFGAILSPALIPYVLAWLPAGYSPEQRWRVIFAGLASAWFLAAAAWLLIDAGKRLPQHQKSEVADQRSEVGRPAPAESPGEPLGTFPRTDVVRPSE